MTPHHPDSIAYARDELVIETRIHHKIESHLQLRALAAQFIAGVEQIQDDLTGVRGYDKDTILDMARDWRDFDMGRVELVAGEMSGEL